MQLVLEAPIAFEVDGEIVHCPVVDAMVGGTMTRLFLDTGASDHVFMLDLADRVSLPREPAEPGTDLTGTPVPSWSLGAVGVVISDVTLPLRDVVAIEGPPPFARWGVGAIVSPQHLHPSAYAVLDLREGTLLLVEGDASEIAAWLGARSPGLRLLSVPRCESDGTVVVEASVEPFAPVPTIVDTGSGGTDFALSAAPGLRGATPESSGRGLSGAEVLGEEVTGQVLRVGDARFPLAMLHMREQMHGAPGLIGMDVLRGTILAVAADMNQPVLWLVPP